MATDGVICRRPTVSGTPQIDSIAYPKLSLQPWKPYHIGRHSLPMHAKKNLTPFFLVSLSGNRVRAFEQTRSFWPILTG
jgi:hypothetical protein